jgi:hypothetical protein
MFWRSSPTQRYIELGRVPCPRMGRDVELDVCFGCKFMEEVREDGRTPFVRCEPPATYFAPTVQRFS